MHTDIERLVLDLVGKHYGLTPGGSPSPGGPWRSVRDFGAAGDGSTDDTSAINAAIAALNAAGRGVLYFPAGDYACTDALDAITVGVTVLGDGMGVWSWDADDTLDFGSRVVLDHPTATLFTVSSQFSAFQGLALQNVHCAAPTGGSAIHAVGTADYHQNLIAEDCLIEGFYDLVDVQVNGQSSFRNAQLYNPVRYGIRVRNTVHTDSGGFRFIGGSILAVEPTSGTRGIRIESSGGNVILGSTIDWMDRCIEVMAAASSSILLVSDCSMEGYLSRGLHLDGNGHDYGQVIITGCQFNHGYSNTSGHAIYVTGMHDIVIDNYVMVGGTGATAFSLNNGTRAKVGSGTKGDFTTLLATSSFSGIVS